MTAEIGVLNTTGVALAADSAVTIGSSKVFNSADKLFSLSKHHPVGIMIYGNAGFMGVPWETIIKVYRKKLNDQKFNTLYGYTQDFLNFLLSDERFYNKDYETSLITNKFFEFLDDLLDDINDLIPVIWKIEPDENHIRQLLFAEAFYFKEKFENYEYVEGFNDDYYPMFFEHYTNEIVDIIKSRVNLDIDDETNGLFVHIAASLVSKSIFTNETGVVISGYGDEEIFPRLYSYSIEGIYNGILKYKKDHEVEIDASERTATIVPFAQQEMVHSFLTGIDPDLKRQITGLIEKITSMYPEVIDSHITRLDLEQKEMVKDFGKDIFKQFVDNVDRMIVNKYSGPIINTVSSFPKEELAAMAEALVNLTSIKRKMSYQTETVGGPIDVAVISKGDGFIWIKRKHYFKAELNPSYFKNYAER